MEINPICMQFAPVPPSGPAGWVTVIGGLFCAPYIIDLTVSRSRRSIPAGKYEVMDINGSIQFKTKRKSVFSLRPRRVLLDSYGNVLLSMEHKVFSLHRRWKVFRGDSVRPEDLLFSVQKSRLLQFTMELDVFLASNTAGNMCDFRIKGSFQNRSCEIFLRDSRTVIARMTRVYSLNNMLLGKDSFAVTIYPNVDYAFVVALIIIFEEIVINNQQETTTVTRHEGFRLEFHST